jgi:hypothetical protein
MSCCNSKSKCVCETFPCVPCLLGGTVVLAAVFGGVAGVPFGNMPRWFGTVVTFALLALGGAAAYAMAGIAAAVIAKHGIRKDPLPFDVEVADRGVAAEQAAALEGKGAFAAQLRRLLSAWGAGASGPQLAAMARGQFARTASALGAETVASGVLLAGGAFLPVAARAMAGCEASVACVPPGMAVIVSVLAVALPFAWIARRHAAAALAGYVEAHLLARIGNDTAAGASAAYAGELAKATGAATETLAGAVDGAAERMARSVGEAQERAAKELAEAQAKTAKEIGEAQRQVAAQLERVADLGRSIDRLLQVQKSVDGALASVASTEEFRGAMTELKRHLAESDALLKQAAKPRRIRLVEGE